MKSSCIAPYILASCVAATFLAACSGPRPPIVTSNSVTRISPTVPAAYSTLYAFGKRPDGQRPSSPLKELNGELYGTTSSGGASKNGTVFNLSSTGTEKVLHSFHGGNADGAGPTGLLNVDSVFYGATSSGGDTGPCDCGTVFSITPSGSETVLHRFLGSQDGAHPSSGLFAWRGALYGTTLSGGDGCGSVGCGTVYGITRDGSEHVLYRFKSGSDGNLPLDNLTATTEALYGETNLGGGSGCYYHNGCGTVYSVTAQGVEKILYRFKGGSDGAYPEGGLIDVNGALYGTTSTGGYENQGTVFSISTSGVEKVLHRFGHGSDGSSPQARLLNVNGTLYGTTWSGGSSDAGTVFSITPEGNEKVLYSLGGSGSSGSNPDAPLTEISGKLYGTTFYGGNGFGTVFALTP